MLTKDRLIAQAKMIFVQKYILARARSGGDAEATAKEALKAWAVIISQPDIKEELETVA